MEQRLDDARRRERALEASRRELVAWVSPRSPDAARGDPRDGRGARGRRRRRSGDRRAVPPTLRTEADRLAALVDDLFELSRTQAGALELQLERVSLAIWSRTRSPASRRSPRPRACGSKVGSSARRPSSRCPRPRCCARCATCSRTRSGTRRATARWWSRPAARRAEAVRLGRRHRRRHPRSRSRADLRRRLPGGPGPDGRAAPGSAWRSHGLRRGAPRRASRAANENGGARFTVRLPARRSRERTR